MGIPGVACLCNDAARRARIILLTDDSFVTVAIILAAAPPSDAPIQTRSSPVRRRTGSSSLKIPPRSNALQKNVVALHTGEPLGEGREGGALYDATLTLFAAIIDGRSRLATARLSPDLRFERILKRAGWPMTRIGEPEQIGRTVAGMVGIRGPTRGEVVHAIARPTLRPCS